MEEREGGDDRLHADAGVCVLPFPPLCFPSSLSVVYLVVMNRLPAQHCSSHKEGTLSPCPSLFIRIYLSISLPPPLNTSLYLILCHSSICINCSSLPPLSLSAGASQRKETTRNKVMETYREQELTSLAQAFSST